MHDVNYANAKVYSVPVHTCKYQPQFPLVQEVNINLGIKAFNRPTFHSVELKSFKSFSLLKYHMILKVDQVAQVWYKEYTVHRYIS